MIAACRIVAGLVFVFYGVEHMLHPMFVPGVPLGGKWGLGPSAHVWGHVIGLLLIAAGVLMVINVQARGAATWLGAALTLTLPVIYVPMLFAAVGPAEQIVAVNYIFDSMLSLEPCSCWRAAYRRTWTGRHWRGRRRSGVRDGIPRQGAGTLSPWMASDVWGGMTG